MHAFDTKGHKAIEKRAYDLVRSRPGGQTILRELIDSNVLSDDMPSPHSHSPDLSFERQFAQDRQMYHFMADDRSVIRASKYATIESRKEQLLLSSVEGCLKAVYCFFREMVRNPVGESQAGRGIYVLMHIIADSYSTEHATRIGDNTGQLVTIKGWQLSRLWWPPNAKSKNEDNTMCLLHATKGTGDHAWQDGKGTLTPNAEMAAHAIADMIVMTYDAQKAPDRADELIGKYIIKYFRPYNTQVTKKGFAFPEYGKVVPYSYEEYYNDPNNGFAFEFDRFPQYYFVATAGGYYTNEARLGSAGIEFGGYLTPRAADNSRTFLSRISLAYGIAANSIPVAEERYGFPETVRMQAFLIGSTRIPILNASLEPRVGLAAYPFHYDTYFTVPWGADLVWNIGSDWVFPFTAATRTLRFSMGYRHDRTLISVRHFLHIGFGFNSWQGRVSN
ncbi:hypothetical protein GCM10023093_26310 [Nemorincola caseinilytica]|uniref:Uncharacterized protein n=1 Tax=Nemorincola caseinilytica TaxID=2054315 RepID=A0ABP8NNT8_9BACT